MGTPLKQRPLRVAVVGSGPAALYCTDYLLELAEAGKAYLQDSIHLFRSRSKMSATQMETEHNTIFTVPGTPHFDYGCQYITSGDPWFRKKMEDYESKGYCHRWPVHIIAADGLSEPLVDSNGKPPGWVGTHGMWPLQENMVGDVIRRWKGKLELHSHSTKCPPAAGTKFPDNSNWRVETFSKNDIGEWVLVDKGGRKYGPYDMLVGAFDGHNQTNSQLNEPATKRLRRYLQDNLRFSPVICAMVVFDRPLQAPFGGAFVVDDPRLAWVSNNGQKCAPDRAFPQDGREFWTFLAPADYSNESFERDPRGYKQRAFKDFLEAFGAILGKDLHRFGPRMIRALHWENGMPANTIPAETGCLFDPSEGLGWCGAFANYGSVEGAALSGKKMAELLAAVSRGEAAPEEAMYPPGAWPDMGVRTPPGYTRLGHGMFFMQHPRLHSIDAPDGRGNEEAAKFWKNFGAYGYGKGGGRQDNAKSWEKTEEATGWKGKSGKGRGGKGKLARSKGDYGEESSWYTNGAAEAARPIGSGSGSGGGGGGQGSGYAPARRWSAKRS